MVGMGSPAQDMLGCRMNPAGVVMDRENFVPLVVHAGMAGWLNQSVNWN